MSRAAAELTAALHVPASRRALHDGAPVSLHDLGLWLGLCLSVRDRQVAARETFRAAARLPGPDPSPDVFPPQTYRLYHGAARARTPRCTWPSITDPPAEIVGSPYSRRITLASGPHHAVWAQSPPYRSPWRGARIRFDSACQLQIDLPKAPRPLSEADGRYTLHERHEPPASQRSATAPAHAPAQAQAEDRLPDGQQHPVDLGLC